MGSDLKPSKMDAVGDFLGKLTSPLPRRTVLGVEAQKVGGEVLTPSWRYDFPG